MGFLLNSPRQVDRVMVITFVYSGYKDLLIQSSSNLCDRGIRVLCPRSKVLA